MTYTTKHKKLGKKEIKPITAYAVVSKKNQKLNVNDIFADKNIGKNKDEKIIKVKIECLEK